MTNYKNLRNHCLHTQHLTSAVIEGFLISYAARQDKLNRKAEKKLARYRHVSKDLPPEWFNMAIAQLIAHRIFKQEGLINRYLHHSGLDHLLDEEISFLEFQANHPWRFSFSVITNQPESDFFEMKDIFTDESYLLYSPALTTIMMTEKVNLCFNLIGFNGECWQTFGPISTYRSFEPQDILFFATQLNRGGWIENGRELMELADEDPVPFMHLLCGANFPRSFHIDDQILEVIAEYLDDTFDADVFRDRFKIEYSQGVYQLSLSGWDQFPHYTAAYYDENEELLTLYSMTDRGFRYLVRQLNSCGYELDSDPDIRVNMGMLDTAGRILKKEFNLNPYSNIFSTELPEEDSKNLDSINTMLSGMMPLLNAGKKVNLDEMSITYNLPIETVKALYEELKNKVDNYN